MQRRNWLDLSRKLVDRYDMDDTETYIAAGLGKNVISTRRYGISPCKAYPAPFQTALSGSDLTATITAGIAFDPSGQVIEMPTTQNFALAAGDATNPRKDLLVLRFATAGSTTIPKPSNPATNVFLNLVDSFSLVVLTGVAAGSPVYPATLANDVILMGFSVPANMVHASQATEDATVRDQGLGGLVKTSAYTVTPFDKFVGADCSGGGVTLTLTEFKWAEGAEWTIQKTDSSGNALTINTGTGGDVFRLNGSTPTTLSLTAQGESVTLKVVGGVCYIL